MVSTIFENHALAMDVVQELLDHSSIHPKKEHPISALQARTMTTKQLYDEASKIIWELRDYPNIIVIKEYLLRFGYFCGEEIRNAIEQRKP